jgi:mono/diheme cytochrome c family protein
MNEFKLSIVSYAMAFAAAAVASAGAALSADSEVAATTDKIARGKYLVTIAGCNDCHTPLKMGENGPEPDWSRMLSGHPDSIAVKSAARVPEEPWLVTTTATTTAWSGPWGVSFTANLTPDAETGLGRWTFRNFKDTIRTGRHMGRGRPILPPMPIPMYKHMTDEDLEAVFSYLRTIPAIKNRVPEPLPPQVAAN